MLRNEADMTEEEQQRYLSQVALWRERVLAEAPLLMAKVRHRRWFRQWVLTCSDQVVQRDLQHAGIVPV